MGGRPRRLAAVAAALVAVSGLAAGCGGGQGQALGLVRQACGHVEASLALYARSVHTSDQAEAASLVSRAYGELRQALPLAARATSDDGQWNGLMTTISESSRVTEGELTNALSEQCAQADSTNPNGAPVGSGNSGAGNTGAGNTGTGSTGAGNTGLSNSGLGNSGGLSNSGPGKAPRHPGTSTTTAPARSP